MIGPKTKIKPPIRRPLQNINGQMRKRPKELQIKESVAFRHSISSHVKSELNFQFNELRSHKSIANLRLVVSFVPIEVSMSNLQYLILRKFIQEILVHNENINQE